MKKFSEKYGIGTHLLHCGEEDHANHSHVSPIYMTSTFRFPSVEAGAASFSGESDAYSYTRLDNPNTRQLARKYAMLEGLDLLRKEPDKHVNELVKGRIFSTGMAAITSAILAKVSAGETIISQKGLYGGTHNFMIKLAPKFGINVVLVDGDDLDAWQAAFEANPNASLAYTETPANPTMEIVDLAAVSEIAHQNGAWVMIDNTFASPYNQRPFNQGVDIIAHSTTKYLTGHGLIVGGAVLSTRLEFFSKEAGMLSATAKVLGASASPFDAWLAGNGLKTFELRMERHNQNAKVIAKHLENHPKVAKVYYPGLESNPGHEVAKKQMFNGFGGMISFELKGGFDSGVALMEHVEIATLAVSLGNVDTLIQHPASMTHANVSSEERVKMGISDGLVRYSVGIENVEDLIVDLEQGLSFA